MRDAHRELCYVRNNADGHSDGMTKKTIPTNAS